MADLNKILMSQEKVTLITRPHWRFIVAGCAIAALLIPAWIWLAVTLSNIMDTWGRIPNIILALVAIFILVRYTIRPILRWLTTRYIFTDHRVMSRSGVLARHGADIPLDKVSNIYYEQRPTDRILRCGSLALQRVFLLNTPDFLDLPGHVRAGGT